jgi:hypothetical protein
VCGPGSIVGIATGYGLDSPGIKSRWGEIFHTCPDRPWGPPSLLYDGYRVFPGGKERLGRDTDPSPPSSAVGHERVELYLLRLWAVAQLVQQLAMGWTVWGSNPGGVRFSTPVQTGPGAHPASCTMGTGSFPGVKSGPGVTLTPHPLLVP